MPHSPDAPRTVPITSADVRDVLDVVRRTGRSAIAPAGARWSDPVWFVAISRGLNPVALQSRIDACAAAQRTVQPRGRRYYTASDGPAL